jgi:hypothetical protein
MNHDQGKTRKIGPRLGVVDAGVRSVWGTLTSAALTDWSFQNTTHADTPRMRSLLGAFLLLVFQSGADGATNAWLISADTRLNAATVEQGRGILSSADDFLRSLSPFDRSSRLRTNGPVALDQFTNFVASQVMAWEEPELNRLRELSQIISNRLAGWSLPLPESIPVIKTTGLEEGDAAYTRGAAIVLPASDLAKPAAELEHVFLHELFHVLSRRNPKLRDALYAQIGFQPCGPVALPPDYAARKLTNPDAPIIEHQLKGRIGEREVHVMPVLFSREATYRAGDTRPFFAYLEFRLMEIERGANGWQPVVRDGSQAFHRPADIGNFFEQIGRNTGYIIHPEEVLADNFVLLMRGKTDVPNPEILTRMAETLRAAAKSGPQWTPQPNL